METNSLKNIFDNLFAEINQAQEGSIPPLNPREAGTVISVNTGIARVSGLPCVGFEELVTFPGDLPGIAFNVDVDEIGVVLLGEYWRLHVGDEVERTGRVMDVIVGDELLGALSTPSAGPTTETGTYPQTSGSRWNALRRILWIARRSQYPFRRVLKSLMHSFRLGADNAN